MPQYKRYKLLLDEMMPRRENFPQLNNLHDLKHIVHDLKKSGLKDYKIIEVARKTGSKKLCNENKLDLIGVVELASFEELDHRIVAYLKKRKSHVMTGTFKNIAQSSR